MVVPDDDVTFLECRADKAFALLCRSNDAEYLFEGAKHSEGGANLVGRIPWAEGAHLWFVSTSRRIVGPAEIAPVLASSARPALILIPPGHVAGALDAALLADARVHLLEMDQYLDWELLELQRLAVLAEISRPARSEPDEESQARLVLRVAGCEALFLGQRLELRPPEFGLLLAVSPWTTSSPPSSGAASASPRSWGDCAPTTSPASSSKEVWLTSSPAVTEAARTHPRCSVQPSPSWWTIGSRSSSAPPARLPAASPRTTCFALTASSRSPHMQIPEAKSTSPVSVSGRVGHLFFSSPDFSAGVLDMRGDDSIRFAGKIMVQDGDQVTLRGAWEKTRYGPQLQVASFEYDLPVEAAGLAHYIARHPRMKGIGPVKAQLIAQHFGADFDRALQEKPDEIARVAKVPVGVPARKNLNRVGRNRYIVRLHEEGHSAADIAGRLFISERTVWRVLARERARRAPSAGADRSEQ